LGRLIVASNRTPSPGEPPSGGLAVALRDALVEHGGGIWFGWSGEVLNRETRGVRLFADEEIDFALADLTEDEYAGYYLGYANRALWPVLHYRVDLAEFDEDEWTQYEAVNSRFGRLLGQLLKTDDVVWIHDYHFMLLGRELRYCGWNGVVGFFLHIPFPSPEIFSALPNHGQIARAMCDFDVIGFQTRQDTENFRRYLLGLDEVEPVDATHVRAHGRTIRIDAFPIGIDTAEIAAFVETPEAKSVATRLERSVEDRALVLGVDRLDYSKGLPQRLTAFGRLLDQHEDLRGRVSLLQIAPVSRGEVDAYADLREEVDRLSGRINSTYADLGWTPIRFLARGYPRQVLAGLYRQARVALITPLHDGMNLVAKEFVAAQDMDDPGVLILSEFAGTAEQFQEALLVNPHDIDAVAEAIRRALEMPLDERQARMKALRENVETEDIAFWRRRFLAALEEVGKA